ncbi:hypothetical protein ACFLVN_04000 [Chloroflexota bacterium]
MIWLIALMMLAFYGLAVSTISGMVTNGINTSLAMATSILEVIIGVIIIRAMYRQT